MGQRLSALGSWICAAFSSSLSACGVLVFIGIAWRERRDRDAVWRGACAVCGRALRGGRGAGGCAA